ncbi:DUF7146 domain-containing protein [Phenylobacterium sp.]|uniref:DUF7146 domain-containing protein n=1 Tax=Phenylobacterium sp. TaxID=1871053 RepID=UPI002FC9E26D
MSERRELPHAPDVVKRELQRRILSLLPALGIMEQPANGMVMPRNPNRDDKRPGSFVIWTVSNAGGVGAWKDYACGESEKGDVFDLIAYLQRLDRWIDAYWWALDFLGMGRGEVRSADQARLDAERHARERRAADARANANAAEAARKAKAFWLGRKPEIRGTLAWKYLTQARGLPLDQLKKPPGALRFDPALDHIDRDTGEVTTWPALVSAMSHWQTDDICAVHRTYLAADGLAKAPVASAKKMLGQAAGGAIRLAKGAGGLTPKAADEQGRRGPLVITEGIEDGLTAVLAQPDYRVWAAGSLSLLGRLGWPPCASAVVLVADNDWDKPQALAAFDKVLAHWKGMAAGRPLKVVRAEAGKDLNDWARGVG